MRSTRPFRMGCRMRPLARLRPASTSCSTRAPPARTLRTSSSLQTRGPTARSVRVSRARRRTRTLARENVLKPEPLERRGVSPPARPDLHDELEVDLLPEDRLDLGARARADLAHHRASLADEDLLLRLRLDKDVRAQDVLV